MLLIFSLLFSTTNGQDVSSCCTRISLQSTGEASTHQKNRLGEYQLTGILNDRPKYTSLDSVGGEEHLFYLRSKSKGLWMVGPSAGQFNGGLAHRGDSLCVEDVAPAQWKYTDGRSWNLDSEITVTCLDKLSDDPVCVYSDQTDFQGGEDLPEVFGGGGVETNPKSSAECIDLCEQTEGCNYWTWIMDEKINCFLKKTKGDSVRRPKYVSGSDPKACSATPPTRTTTVRAIEEVDNDIEEPAYDDKEINGKFKIMMAWDDKFNDPESEEYKSLAKNIENDLVDMLRKERDLSEQVEKFTVKVQKFKRGSVVCDFKVNYILKEAYIAIPFAIKPSNITDAMNNNFKFKKGILFQRFLIAGGSFDASSPVDHCAAKGCSHKCNYDYDVEEYLCTCPRDLILASDGLNCVSEEEEEVTELYDGPREDTDSTTKPEIEIALLPTNCLWGPWSDWGQCTVTCGKGQRERTRTVAIPEKNGGACNGEPSEFVECEFPCEEVVDVDDETISTTTEPEVEVVTSTSVDQDSADGRINPDVITDSITTEKEDAPTTVSNIDSEETTVASEDDDKVVFPDTDDDTEDADVVDTTTAKIEESDIATDDSIDLDDFGAKITTTSADDLPATTEESVEATTSAVNIIFPVPENVDGVETTTEEEMMDDMAATIGVDEDKLTTPSTSEEQTTVETSEGEMSSDTSEVDGSDSSTLQPVQVETTTLSGEESPAEVEQEVTTLKTETDQPEIDDTVATERTDEVVMARTEEIPEVMDDITTATPRVEPSIDDDVTTSAAEDHENVTESEVVETTISTMEDAPKEVSTSANNLSVEVTTPVSDSEEATSMSAVEDEEQVTSESPVADSIDDVSGDVTTQVSETDEATTVSAVEEVDVSIDVTTPVSDSKETTTVTSEVVDATTVSAIEDENVSDDVTTVSADEDVSVDVTTVSTGEDVSDDVTTVSDEVTTVSADEDEEVSVDVTTVSADENVSDDVTTVAPVEDEASDNEEVTTSETVSDEAIDVSTEEAVTKDAETTEAESVDVTTVKMVDDEVTVSPDVDVDVSTITTDTSSELTTVTDADDEVLTTTTEKVQDSKDDTTVSTDTDVTTEKEENATGVPALDDPTVTTTTVKSDEETTPAKLPRFDDPETTPLIIEVEPVTTETSIDSLSLVTDKEMTTLAESEETTKADPSLVTVVTVQEDDDSVTIVTMRPTTGITEDDTPAAPVDTAITTTTTMQSITEDEITTAPADQQFICSQTEAVIENNEDVPMECKHMDGDEEKTVLLIIPRDSLGDVSLDRLFDKNVKIIVKDFMIMDRSPRRL